MLAVLGEVGVGGNNVDGLNGDEGKCRSVPVISNSERRKLADSLWTKGAAHAESAKELSKLAAMRAREKNSPDEEGAAFTGTYSPSIHLLIGYSFELLLKAAYTHHGGDRDSLRRDLRHDLSAVLTAATEAGFETRIDSLAWIVKHLRDPHRGNEFRYGQREKVTMPSFSQSLPALDALVREVGRLVVPEWPINLADSV